MRLPSPGELFEHKYLIKEALGEGGFASVFRATDVEIARDVAIKFLTPQDGEYAPGVVARFMLEARVIAGLKDPHTIRLFEFGESAGGLLYSVFQYVAGTDLASVLRQRGALPPETAIHVATQVLTALAEAHQFDILHRDVKPANILIHGYMGDQFSAKLLDFGIAKSNAVGGGIGLTKTGVVIGTLAYMSPEQACGEPLTPASDIYSVGLVLYEMLTGKAAIAGSQKEMLTQQLTAEPIILPATVGWPTLRELVERMLAPEPHARFARALDAVAALQHALEVRGERPLPPFATTVAEVAPRPSRRGEAVAAVVVLLLSITGAVAFFGTSEPDPPPVPPRAVPLATSLIKSTAPIAPSTSTDSTDPTSDVGTSADMPADIPAEEVLPAHHGGCGRVISGMPEWIVADGRRVRVVLPSPYDPYRAYPVIMAFTPKYLTPSAFMKDAKLHLLPLSEPVIVAAPEPYNRLNPWSEADDVEAIRSAIREVAGLFCVDRSQIYAYGHHDGGHFARELPCELPFSGVVLTGYAEKAHRDTCPPRTPFPVLWVLGRNDDFIPIEGGQGCTSGAWLSAAKNDERWMEQNGCKGKPRTWLEKGETACKTWDCDVPLVSCLAGGGHHLDIDEWALLFPRCGAAKLEFDVPGASWAFFQQFGHRLTPKEQQRIFD